MKLYKFSNDCRAMVDNFSMGIGHNLFQKIEWTKCMCHTIEIDEIINYNFLTLKLLN